MSTRSTVASSCECCAAAACSPADIRVGSDFCTASTTGRIWAAVVPVVVMSVARRVRSRTHGVADLGGRHPGRQVGHGRGQRGGRRRVAGAERRRHVAQRALGLLELGVRLLQTSSSVSTKTCLGMYDGPAMESVVSREPDTGGPRTLDHRVPVECVAERVGPDQLTDPAPTAPWPAA